MTERNTDSKKTGQATGKAKPKSPDTLIKSGEAGKIELNEDELKDVSGGAAVDYFNKVKL